jgi:hypothetical protein
MSFDRFSDPDQFGDSGQSRDSGQSTISGQPGDSGERPSPAGNPDDPTTELGAAATTLEEQYGPVSFIRESWLLPPPPRLSPEADTDPLTVIYSGRSINLPEWARRLTVAAALFVVALISCLGYLAIHNAHAADTWQQRAVAQVALTQKVSEQLKQANDHITTLDGTVGSLQGQLATATSKEKANSGLGGALRHLLWPFG